MFTIETEMKEWVKENQVDFRDSSGEIMITDAAEAIEAEFGLSLDDSEFDNLMDAIFDIFYWGLARDGHLVARNTV